MTSHNIALVAAYLLIFGSRAGLAWVLENERMAFSAANASRASRLEPGDRLFIYTARGTFKNFRRDRGRLIGEAEVESPVKPRKRPVQIDRKSFSHDCEIDLLNLATCHEGLELGPLVIELEAFPNPGGYSAQLRRPLVALPPADANLIRARLKRYVRDPRETIADYLADQQRAAARLAGRT
jgi:hypothetical protein